MKHTFLRGTGALLLALILALSLAPAALAEDAYTITPAAWTLEVGQTAELTARLNGGALPSGVSVEWTGTDAVSIKENYGNIVQIQADAPTPDGEPALVKAVFSRDGEEVGEAKCSVTVRAAKVTGVTLNKTELSLAVGGREQLTATVVPSTTDSETYAWLGDIPGMREWIGDREIQNITASGYTIKNKNFESTISVDRNAVDDDKLGLYNVQIQALARTAAAHPDGLVFDLLAAGFTEKCFDGKPFFSDGHTAGEKTVSNMSHDKLTLDAYIKRLEKLEEIANAHAGVERTYAIQAGREVRVMVEPEVVDEAASVVLAHDIAQQIENEMQYPGQVKVVVIRESRAVDYAK